MLRKEAAKLRQEEIVEYKHEEMVKRRQEQAKIVLKHTEMQ